ncbi:hypothetical protein AVEN_61476-1 [Araneus ventricosus]|uniref:Uncharacterized protein n=1 Tax=Araneus ventricosus TaxID=182803 RepID=A0A4Y2LIH6_ARAVE|nr:hypothetical protein AVEN_61476-1 [Araneus ventricosus]
MLFAAFVNIDVYDASGNIVHIAGDAAFSIDVSDVFGRHPRNAHVPGSSVGHLSIQRATRRSHGRAFQILSGDRPVSPGLGRDQPKRLLCHPESRVPPPVFRGDSACSAFVAFLIRGDCSRVHFN